MLSACEIALDVARAAEWMAVAGSFGAWSDFVSPVCRTHYGGILIATGSWDEAEEQLMAALHTFESSYRGMSGWPLAKLADLRVRQGRFDEARRLIEGHESQTGARRVLAVIALGRGEVTLAEELLSLCLDGEAATDPRCAPVLEMLVQIRVARDDMLAANEALRAARKVAGASRDAVAAAFAELAAGRVRFAEGDGPRWVSSAALRGFTALQLPLEAARAQRELARALAKDAPEAAVAEARLALRAFERIGAAADADATAALLRRLGAGGRAFPKHYGQLTKRETEVLALLADGCSNDEIAKRLVISRRTAEHHVAHILSKLGLRSRAEAAAYAARSVPKTVADGYSYRCSPARAGDSPRVRSHDSRRYEMAAPRKTRRPSGHASRTRRRATSTRSTTSSRPTTSCTPERFAARTASRRWFSAIATPSAG